MVTNIYYPNFLKVLLRSKVGAKKVNKSHELYDMRLYDNPEINCKCFFESPIYYVNNLNLRCFENTTKNFYLEEKNFDLLLLLMRLHNYVKDDGRGFIEYGDKRLEIEFIKNRGINLIFYHNDMIYIVIRIFIRYNKLTSVFLDMNMHYNSYYDLSQSREYKEVEEVFNEFSECKQKRNRLLRFLFKNKSKYVKDW